MDGTVLQRHLKELESTTMRVDRVYLRHIGPFEDGTITLPSPEKKGLADVHLLTGPNGSGKGTLLYAIADVLASDARLGKDLSAARLRTKDSIAGVDCGGLTAQWLGPCRTKASAAIRSLIHLGRVT